MDALRLIPCLRPHGRFLLAPSDEGPELEPALAGRLRQGFARGRCPPGRAKWTNRQKQVVEKYGLRNVHLYEGEEWIRCHAGACGRDGLAWLQPATVVFPAQPVDAIREPDSRVPSCGRCARLRLARQAGCVPGNGALGIRFIGEDIIHLPTCKTHVFTTMTGAMKNAFGGLLHEKRHFTHVVIHETLVDLLAIQKEIQSGIFAVMDDTWASDGPRPRYMVPYEKDILLASADQVAIDAISAK